MKKEYIQLILDAYRNGDFQTDSDIEDFVDLPKCKHIKFDDVLRVIANNSPEYEQCWGCKHIINLCYISQPWDKCYQCSRRMQCADNYTQDEENYKL